MSGQRRVEAQIEIRTTPEQAWEAIATGPGISAWFMPAEIGDPREGGTISYDYGGEQPSEGTITGYDAPGRFAYVEEALLPQDAGRPIATEFLVEARGGGTCVVRVVMSGFGDQEAWDRAMESYGEGWQHALLSLRLYLENFPGQSASNVMAARMTKAPRAELWARFASALGLPSSPAVGDRIATAGGAPGLAGRVEDAGDQVITLLLDEPAPGICLVAVGGPGGDEVMATVRAQLFGDGAAQVAEREQARWDEWFVTFAT
jgi:uncharacterized protein YndB with AHSA1/START domain